MRRNQTLSQEQLLESLAEYGYPLLRQSHSPEVVLKNLLEGDDFRLMEGFPIVLANILQGQETFSWEKSACSAWQLTRKAQKRLPVLLALSYLLFQGEGLGQNAKSRVLKLLQKFPDGKQVLKNVTAQFSKSERFKAGGEEFSVERFKNAFQTYRTQMGNSSKDQDSEKKKHDLQFELLLSEVFTPRQKLLLRKRLEAKPLTKTEREYFSRVLKKRLRALASDELHRMAHQLLLGV